MKKIISMFLATIMIISCFASIPTTVQAANKQIKTIGISSKADFETKVANGYVGSTEIVSCPTYEDKERERMYNFTLTEDCYAYINIISKTTKINGGSSNIYTSLYNSTLTKTYYQGKSANGNEVATLNTLTYLPKGTYTLYVRYSPNLNNQSTNLTVNIGTLSKNTNFLSATYMGAVSKNSQTIKLKINSLDRIENIYYYVSNGARNYDYSMLNTVGEKVTLDSDNCMIISLEGEQGNRSYPYIDIAIKDVYGITHAVEYQILNDYTVTTERITNKTYTGKPITQNKFTVYAGYKTSTAPTYKVSYKNNTNVGTAQMIITGTGNTLGSVTKTFKINPKGTSISKIAAAKKGFKVYWKKQSSQVTGYQIQYATNSKFSKAKTKTVNKNSYTSKNVSKLSAKKRYYVRVRTYKTVKINGKNTNIYSKWSKAKSVTTKK